MKILKYIGPFLRMNSLTLENLENQLFFFAKESLKHIVLKSRCGITQMPKNFKKIIPNNDINIIKDFSPLLCIYRKANPKLIKEKDYAYWDNSTFKKEILPTSCAFMTLSIMELIDYYQQFKDKDNSLYTLSILYKSMAKHQLDFYTSYLRNPEGVFITKKNVSEDISDDLRFEDKENKYKFSDQAFMMAAFLRYSYIDGTKDSEAYRSFSKDILRMLIHYRDAIYDLSFEEINRICFALNIAYSYSKDEEVKYFIMDITDLLVHYYHENSNIKEKIDHSSLFIINLNLSYNICDIEYLKDMKDDIKNYMFSLYDKEKGILMKNTTKKEIKYSSEDLIMFMVSALMEEEYEEELGSLLVEVYKHQIVNSKLITNWPESPSLDNPERYLGFTLDSEDLMDEQNFRLSTLDSPESNEYAPIFLKSLEYNVKKDIFTPSKTSFDSSKNMNLLFIIIFILKNSVYKNYNITK